MRIMTTNTQDRFCVLCFPGTYCICTYRNWGCGMGPIPDPRSQKKKKYSNPRSQIPDPTSQIPGSFVRLIIVIGYWSIQGILAFVGTFILPSAIMRKETGNMLVHTRRTLYNVSWKV